MSTSIGNLAVVVSAQTDPAEARIRDLRKTFGLLDRDAKTLGKGAGGTAAAVLAGDRGAAAKAQAQAAREQRQAQRVERQQAAQHAREKERAARAEQRRAGQREQASRESAASRAVVATAALGPEMAGLLGFAGPAGVAVAAIALVKDGFNATVPEALRLAGAAEQNAAAFEVMLGSASKAQTVLAGLRKYAADSPFNSPQVMEAAKRLQAYGVAGDDLVNTLKALGDIAAGTGGDLNLMAVAYGQVRTNGRLMGQELLQFTNQGVPLIENVAAVMGKPQESIKKLIEDGEVGFDVVQKAINRMTTGGGKFAGMADKYGATFAGLTDRVKDASDGLLRDFGTSLIEDLDLKEWMRGGLSALADMKPVLQDLRPLMKGFGEGGKVVLYVLKESVSATRALMAAATGVGTALKPFVDSVFDPMHRLVGDLKAVEDAGGIDWNDMADSMLNAIENVGGPLASLFDGAIAKAKELRDTVKPIADQIERLDRFRKQGPGGLVLDEEQHDEFGKRLTKGLAGTGAFEPMLPKGGMDMTGWRKEGGQWVAPGEKANPLEGLKEPPAEKPLPKEKQPLREWSGPGFAGGEFDDGPVREKPKEAPAGGRDLTIEPGMGMAATLRAAVAAGHRGIQANRARQIKEATENDASGIRVEERFPAKLQERAMKAMASDSPYADPREKFAKEMADIARMYRGTLTDAQAKLLEDPALGRMGRGILEAHRKIDGRTRDLMVNEEVMRLGGRDLSERRPAPAIEQGTQEAVRLQQQATVANRTADPTALLAKAVELLEQMRKDGEASRRVLEKPNVVYKMTDGR